MIKLSPGVRKETPSIYPTEKFPEIFTLCINYLFNLLKSLYKSSFETLAKLLNLLVSLVQAKILADTMNACILLRGSNVNSFWNCKIERHCKGRHYFNSLFSISSGDFFHHFFLKERVRTINCSSVSCSKHPLLYLKPSILGQSSSELSQKNFFPVVICWKSVCLLSRSQIFNLCNYMGVEAHGTWNMTHFDQIIVLSKEENDIKLSVHFKCKK